MKAYVTLLERCGFDVWIYGDGYKVRYGDTSRSREYTPDELKAYALDVGAKDAMEALNRLGAEVRSEDGGRFYTIPDRTRRRRRVFTNLELIQEATKAGWEKGGGL